MPFPDDLAVFDEAAMVSELELHSLFDDMSDRHHVLGDHRDVQDVPQPSFLVDMAQRYVSDVLDWIRGIVANFDDPWLFQLFEM